MPDTVKAIPEGYEGATPYRIIKGAAGALEFYKNAFGASEVMRVPGPGGTVGHAEINCEFDRFNCELAVHRKFIRDQYFDLHRSRTAGDCCQARPHPFGQRSAGWAVDTSAGRSYQAFKIARPRTEGHQLFD